MFGETRFKSFDKLKSNFLKLVDILAWQNILETAMALTGCTGKAESLQFVKTTSF